MKILLIVFPHPKYVRWEEESHLGWVQSVCRNVSDQEFVEEYCEWPSYLVNSYRRKHYEIWYITHGKYSDPSQPSLRSVSKHWGYKEGDTLVSSGVTFKQLCSWWYPNFDKLVSVVPKDVQEVVVGGFHYGDCVKKTAQAALKHIRRKRVCRDPKLSNLLYHDLAIELSSAPSYRPDEEWSGLFLF